MLANELVRITHLLTNAGGKTLDVSPWALSTMAPGGVALMPQPALDLHPSEFPDGRAVKPEEFLPNREMILWPFTDLTDGRYAFSENFLRLTYLPEMRATKLGLKLPTGWVGYQLGDVVFAKHFPYDSAQPYPDRGCNFEIFTNHQILELRIAGPDAPARRRSNAYAYRALDTGQDQRRPARRKGRREVFQRVAGARVDKIQGGAAPVRS